MRTCPQATGRSVVAMHALRALRLPRGGHFFFLGHHLGVWVLLVLFVLLLIAAILNSRR